MNPHPEHNSSKWWKPTKKMITSLAGVAAAAYIGYLINDYLSRERVSVESIQVKPLTFTYEVESKFQDKLKNVLGRFSIIDQYESNRQIGHPQWTADEIIDSINKLSKDYDSKKKLKSAFINDNNTLNNIEDSKGEKVDEELKQLYLEYVLYGGRYNSLLNDEKTVNGENSTGETSFGRGSLESINFADEDVTNDLPTTTTNLPVIPAIRDTGNRSRNTGITRSYAKSEVKTQILDAISETTKYMAIIKNDADKLHEIAVTAIRTNANKFQLEVVLFNAGDKQAVVRYKGRLEVDGNVVNLKRKIEEQPIRNEEMKELATALSRNVNSEEFLSDFVIIPSKSFAGMTLVVDNFNVSKSEVEFLQRECVEGQRMAKLVMFDIEDKASREKIFPLRNALDDDDGGSVNAFLEKTYPTLFQDDNGAQN